MPTSTEARELELVGKVEMRIALAKDDKLESTLKPYLAPLLLKLASEHASVRNKVREFAVCILPGSRSVRLYQHANILRSAWRATSKTFYSGMTQSWY
jgi:hypothetical protein